MNFQYFQYSVVVIIPTEEYFDTLLHCHRATGYDGRDKMGFVLKNKFYVPTPAVEQLVQLCKAIKNILRATKEYDMLNDVWVYAKRCTGQQYPHVTTLNQ